jgi:amidase
VVGVKPTVGLVGRSGVIPIGFTRDSLGPMARTVTDAALALEVLAGIDPDDPGRTVGAETAPWAMFENDPTPQPGEGDYTSGLSADALKGKKIAIASNMGGYDEGSQALFVEAVELIKSAGAEVVEVGVGVDGEFNTYTLTSLPEFAWGLQEYLDVFTPDGPMQTIQDIVDYGNEHADEVIVGVADQSGLTDALGAMSLDDPAYIEETNALVTGARTNGIDAVMDAEGLDAFIAPTCGTAVGVWDHTFKGSSSGVSSLAGYPAVTLPIGLADDLPVGINFFGRAFSEADLLAFAFALEQLLPPRAVPTYIPREE